MGGVAFISHEQQATDTNKTKSICVAKTIYFELQHCNENFCVINA